MEWPSLSSTGRELVRRAAREALAPDPERLAEVDAATLGAQDMRAVAEDPVLRELARRVNLANIVHWATENVREPGRPVPPALGEAQLELARELVRRGLDETNLDAVRASQNTAWLWWMRIVFSLTADAGLLREVLDVSARSIADFCDATVAAVGDRIRLEREELTSGTNAERREMVTLLVEGAPVPVHRAEARLGYRLEQAHTAAVLWSEEREPDPGALDRAAKELLRISGARHRLHVIAGARTVWVWVAGHVSQDAALSYVVADEPGVFLALGSPGSGPEGFRCSHLEAVAVQRMLARLRSPHRAARFTDVELVSLISADDARAGEFLRRVLGELATAPPELRESVRVYLRQQCNVSRAAARLFTHRNTLLRRLQRAETLLPQPLAENSVEVAVALDVLHWRG